MMGEEGYDIARDMGRVPKTRDKKDATTMPPSKEMEKTRKVNKGPSALELVKKKYRGQIMDVEKEELDLTQVAEVFGGYIIEAPVDSEGNIKPKTGDAGRERRLINKEIKKITQPKPGDIKKEKQTLQKFIKSTDDTASKNKAAGDKLLQDINKRKSADLTRADAINRAMGTSGSTEGAGGAGGSSGSKRSKPDITGAGGRNRTRVTGGKPRSTDADLSRMSAKDQETYQKIKDTTPKGGIPDWMKQVDKKRKEIQQQPYQKGIKPALKRTFLTKDKGVRGLLKSIKKDPITTAVAAGLARDSFRMPQLPKAPTVQGGKVGRRTAG